MNNKRASQAQAIQLARLGCRTYLKGNFTTARQAFRHAVELEPDNADLRNDLGAACYELGLFEEAAEAAQQALDVDPHHVQAHISRGALSLRATCFRQGWEDYEWLCKMVPALTALPANLRWSGGEVRGKDVLVPDEQGFGDTLQFIRFAPLLAERGARVLLKVKPSLRALLEANPHLGKVLQDGDTAHYHSWTPLVALPRLLGVGPEHVGQLPYLTAPGGRVPTMLRERNRLNVGLIWTGSPRHIRNPIRSIPLPELLPLLSLAKAGDYRFFHLHYQLHSDQIEAAGAADLVVELSQSINDFAELADVIANLDLVIATDTAVPHLAGALGKPVWLLLSHVADWRWTTDDGGCPWYPSMKIYRQPSHGDWGSVVEKVVGDLARFVPDRQPLHPADGAA